MTTFSQSIIHGHPNQITNVNVTFHGSAESVKSTFSTLNSVGNLYSITTAKSVITVGQSTVQPHFAVKTSTSHTSLIQHVSDKKHHISTSTSTTSGNSLSQSMTVGKRAAGMTTFL